MQYNKPVTAADQQSTRIQFNNW